MVITLPTVVSTWLEPLTDPTRIRKDPIVFRLMAEVPWGAGSRLEVFRIAEQAWRRPLCFPLLMYIALPSVSGFVMAGFANTGFAEA
jgi:hypothetical protein